MSNRAARTDFAQQTEISNHADRTDFAQQTKISYRAARKSATQKMAADDPCVQVQEIAILNDSPNECLNEKPSGDQIESESRRRENLPQSLASTWQPQGGVKADRSLQHESGNSTSNRRYLSAELRRLVWARDQGRCRQCDSTRYIEIDHMIPLALGGSDEADNLRLLCRSCNQRSAIETLGQTKMQTYFEREQGV
jgi:HNH endonuclease